MLADQFVGHFCSSSATWTAPSLQDLGANRFPTQPFLWDAAGALSGPFALMSPENLQEVIVCAYFIISPRHSDIKNYYGNWFISAFEHFKPCSPIDCKLFEGRNDSYSPLHPHAEQSPCVGMCAWIVLFLWPHQHLGLCASPPQTSTQVCGLPFDIVLVLLGSQYPIFRCVNRNTHEEVPESYCDSSTKPTPEEEPCSIFPCPAL